MATPSFAAVGGYTAAANDNATTRSHVKANIAKLKALIPQEGEEGPAASPDFDKIDAHVAAVLVRELDAMNAAYS